MVYKVVDVGDIVCLSYDVNGMSREKYVEIVTEHEADQHFREVAGYQIMQVSQYSPAGEQLLGSSIGTKISFGTTLSKIMAIYHETELQEKRDRELYKTLCDLRDNDEITCLEFGEMLDKADVRYLSENMECDQNNTKSKCKKIRKKL